MTCGPCSTKRKRQFQGALKGTNLRGQTEPKRRFSLIFADFCWFSAFPRKQSIWEMQIFAENRWFSQETAENRRNRDTPRRFHRTPKRFYRSPKGSIEPPFGRRKGPFEPQWNSFQNHREGSIGPFASKPPFTGHPFKTFPIVNDQRRAEYGSESTIRISRITFYLRECKNYTPPINFWGVNKRNFRDKLHLVVLSLLGRITPSFTLENSQVKLIGAMYLSISYTRKFLGNYLLTCFHASFFLLAPFFFFFPLLATLVTRHFPYRPPNRQKIKDTKKLLDSKVTFGRFQAISGNFRQFQVILGNLGAHRARKKTSFNWQKKAQDCTPKVTFLCLWFFWGVWGSVGEMAGHKATPLPLLFSAPFCPFLPLEKCSVL